jgi:hypothetical protein
VLTFLRFHFTTREFTASGSAVAAGVFVAATNFDPDGGAFATLNQIQNYSKSASFAPYAKHVVHDVMEARAFRDLAPVKNYYVSGSANQLTPVTGQAKFYDVGNFQVCGSENIDATTNLVDMWVEYSFTMIRPVEAVPQGDSILAAHYTTTPVTASSRFLSGSQQTGSNMSLTLAANTITLPFAGNFLVSCLFSAATSYTDANTCSAGTNGTLLTVFSALGVADTNNGQSGAGSGGTFMIWNFVISCTAPGVVVTFAGTPTIVGTTKADIWIAQVPSDIITMMNKLKDENRIDKLERMVKELSQCRIRCDSDFDDEKTELPRSTNKLSDSVVDLMISKLRK